MRRVAISAGVRTSPCRPSITKYQITRPRTSLRSLGGLVGNRQRRRASTIGRIRDVAARSPLSRLTESPIIRRRWRRSEEPPRPGTTAQAQPESVEFKGAMISGATNTVHLQVASLPDFVVMKAHAVQGRDKPKDVDDICYCLDEYPNGIELLAADWRARAADRLVRQAVEILREKFETVEHFGPQQLAIFHDSPDQAEREMHARRAFEIVQK